MHFQEQSFLLQLPFGYKYIDSEHASLNLRIMPSDIHADMNKLNKCYK